MTNKRRYKGLLVKYLLNELDEQETRQVRQWLDESDKNRRYFEELKNTLGLTSLSTGTNTIDAIKEWNDFRQALQFVKSEEYLDTEPFEMNVPRTEIQRGKLRRIYFAGAWAAAASVVLALGLWWWTTGDHKDDRVTKQVRSVQNDSEKRSATPILRHETNMSASTKTIALSDGSAITLEAKTEVSFIEPFIGGTRNITLAGKAYFNVAKNKSKPFIVSSGDLSTIVLSTRFYISAYPRQRHISVRLMEGRVLIRSGDTVKRKLKKEFYLLPGQELVYDKLRVTAIVSSFKPGTKDREQLDEDSSLLEDNPMIPRPSKVAWYMFNNQALADVFEQLKAVYQVDIVYTRKDLENKFFIGRFNKSDSLANILRQICVLNDLKVVKRDNVYIISK